MFKGSGVGNVCMMTSSILILAAKKRYGLETRSNLATESAATTGSLSGSESFGFSSVCFNF